jgi:hypothetical protein
VRSLLTAAVLAASAFAQAAEPASVYPAGPTVPSNLLRLVLEFAAPQAAAVLPRLELQHADGSPIEQPFLEQELWSPDGKLLTVLLHPGRVKSGLAAGQARGPVLQSDEAIVLLLDGRAIKRWQVIGADHQGPVPGKWQVGAVRAGSRAPLVVDMDEEIDRNGLQLIAVADARERRVPGRAKFSAAGRRWIFMPFQPWHAGQYAVAVHGQLEDPSGNRAGSRFELPSATVRPAPRDTMLPFRVQALRFRP